MIGTDEQEINSMIESLEKNSKRVDEQRIELEKLLREKHERRMMIWNVSINNIKIMNKING